MNQTPAKRTYRKFDESFKRETVIHWLTSGKSAETIAQELEISANLLYAWKKRFAPADAGGRAAAGAKPGHARRGSGAIGSCPARNPPPARAARHSKKNFGHHLRNARERYERIDTMKTNHSIVLLCELFEVSPSGYYDWQKRRHTPSPRAQQNQELCQEIKSIHQRSRQTYGSPRVQADLRKQGRKHGRNRIARLMKEQGLCGRQKGRWRLKTTDSNHDQPIAPNRLADAPAPTAPNQVCVGDITYIRTSQGWHFLAAILDLHSPKIVGWSMGPWIDTALILAALQMARRRNPPSGPLLFHSDRGVQYASEDYRQALARAGLVASMSRKANCYDNAAMESFWSTLKLELVYRQEFQTRQNARSEIFDYIETFYNRQRAHSALGYVSPIDFETQNN
jgi:transposase InsO family protein/transposase-like protein